jgi:hypothetical protein
VKKISAKGKPPCPARSGPNNLPHHSDGSKREVRNRKRVPADDLGKLTDFVTQIRTKRIALSWHGTAEAEPGFSSEPLTVYKYDQGLARQEEVMLTVKTTLQVNKNDRQEEHMKRPNAAVFGREAARPYVPGIGPVEMGFFRD